MSKRNILTLLLDSIFILAFNIIFFMNIKENNSSVIWICYGFLHFAYLMVLLTPFFEAKEYFSKLSSYAISFVYFLLEIILASIIIFFNIFISTKFLISIQVVITAIYLIVYLTNLLTNDSILNKQTKKNINDSFIKNCSSKLKYIESIILSEESKKIVSDLYYTFHSSPAKSSVEVSFIEEQIVQSIDEMEHFAEENKNEELSNLIIKIKNLIYKRNSILKTTR